jgi:hypothetical protein
MRPFRSRVMAAIVLAILVLGLLGTAADAAGFPARPGFHENPRGSSGIRHFNFPEDPWELN